MLVADQVIIYNKKRNIQIIHTYVLTVSPEVRLVQQPHRCDNEDISPNIDNVNIAETKNSIIKCTVWYNE